MTNSNFSNTPNNFVNQNQNQNSNFTSSNSNQSNFWTIPSGVTIAASFSQGSNWVLSAFKSLFKLEFWVFVLILFLGWLVGIAFGFIPGASVIIATFSSAFCFSYLGFIRYGKVGGNNPSFLNSFSLINGNFVNILCYSIFEFILSCLVVMLIIFFTTLICGFEIFTMFKIIYADFKECFLNEEVINNLEDPEVIYNQTVAFLTEIFQNSNLIAMLVRHFFVGTMVGLIFGLIQYMFTFYALPLVVCSRMKPCKALLVSFKAFNKNWISITAYGIVYFILTCTVFFIAIIPVLFLNHVGILPSALIGVLAYNALKIIHMFITFNATEDCFLYAAKAQREIH